MRRILIVLFALLMSTGIMSAQYGVVRKVEGSCNVGGQPVTVNYPIQPEDVVSTFGVARMNILLPEGGSIWLGSRTSVRFNDIPDDFNGGDLALEMAEGVVYLSVRGQFRSHYSVLVAGNAFVPSQSGEYAAEIGDGGIVLSCYRGSARVLMPGEVTITIQSGNSLMLNGMGGFVGYGRAKRYGFVDQRYDSTPSYYSYLPENTRAYAEDFDGNGTWYYSSEYGNVWCPTVVSGWNPYYNGYWANRYWGRTWISYESWGWVPFHYGRWVFVTSWGWCWTPMSLFSGAWVSFYYGDDYFGWCPLGYSGYPLWEHCGWWSVPSVNVYNTNITNVIVHHRQAPAPKPIYPRANGTPTSISNPRSPRNNPTTIARNRAITRNVEPTIAQPRAIIPEEPRYVPREPVAPIYRQPTTEAPRIRIPTEQPKIPLPNPTPRVEPRSAPSRPASPPPVSHSTPSTSQQRSRSR